MAFVLRLSKLYWTLFYFEDWDFSPFITAVKAQQQQQYDCVLQENENFLVRMYGIASDPYAIVSAYECSLYGF